MELNEMEVKILKYFYNPPENAYLLNQINGKERFEQRKAAIEHLKSLGLLEEVEPWIFRISHKGHVLIDEGIIE